MLDQIVINLAVPNNLAFTGPDPCRVLLTTTVEATTVGNTILISKGLIDSLPNEPAIASVVAMELAHIAMGHHIDTRYAFNDRLLFPDEATFQRIDMYHSDHDNAGSGQAGDGVPGELDVQGPAAGRGALSMRSWWTAAKALKPLNTPKLGDSLLKPDGTPWMAHLQHMAPKLNWDDLTQTGGIAAGQLAEDRSRGTTRCTC